MCSSSILLSSLWSSPCIYRDLCEAVNRRTLFEKRAEARFALVARDLRQPKSRWSLAQRHCQIFRNGYFQIEMHPLSPKNLTE